MSVMVKSVDDCFAFTGTNQLDPGSMFLIVIFLNSTASAISELTLAPHNLQKQMCQVIKDKLQEINLQLLVQPSLKMGLS